MRPTNSRAVPIWAFPSRHWAVTLLVCAFLLSSGIALHAQQSQSQDDSASRRAAAHAQFARAETQREVLEAKSEHEQTVQDYKQVVSAYRRVYLITPHAAEVPQALNQVGALYRAMGQRFDHAYYDSAVETYEFLLHEYPASRYRQDAPLEIAGIQRNGLAQPNLAQKAYEDFLKQYPHAERAQEARRALAEMQADDKLSAVEPAAPPAILDNASEATGPGVDDSSASEVGAIRVWNADTYTRIVIALGGQAKYQTARIDDPDRIYFDIDSAKLNRQLLRAPIDIPSGGYLKSIRVAENRANIVRVVLEVTKVKDYSVFELANPDRLVVDVYGPHATAGTTTTSIAGMAPNGAPAKGSATSASISAVAPASGPSASLKNVKANVPPGASGDGAVSTATVKKSAAAKADLNEGSLDDRVTAPSPKAARAKGTTAASSASPATPANSEPTLLSAKAEAGSIGPAAVPARTHSGQRSLTRALGLKIGRIVIDAGHGGHDTGTIGPTGLMEKDLCLDVALRLGKLIQDRVPGADVVYTRDDDAFVPLEQRTTIANEAKADLFLSIHANSSEDKRASGIETYYLNFNASPEAMEVASRENALAQGSVHDLQDLVKKIARNEKIEESRDFATDIQDSLTNRIGRPEPNRGVRKAPFVVLIGADMPSVLAEISFISNPSDEQWLKKPENRQHIADGLYQGIASYLQSTNSLTMNTTTGPSSGTPSGAVAHSSDPQ